MTCNTLTSSLPNKLFACCLSEAEHDRPRSAHRRKEADRGCPMRAGTVLASSNASVLGYRSNNQPRET